ncbi:MAG: alpha/beta hydrolase [Burkholderiaceae bacterium]
MGSATLALGLAAMIVSGWVESFFFYPDNVRYSAPGQFGLKAEDVWLRAVDGSRLHAWFLPAQGGTAARGTVLHLHGNAANVSNHLPLVAWLPAQGYNVVTLDYRGFGKSEGKPSLDGVVDDAAVALAYLRTRPDVDADRLIVLGQSLGGATALRLLARDPAGVRLAIIEAAFTGYRTIARDATVGPLAALVPLAVSVLPPPDQDPIAALAHIRVPLIFVHGTRDRVIPEQHSAALHAAAISNKHLWIVPNGEHVATFVTDGEWRRKLVLAMNDAVR